MAAKETALSLTKELDTAFGPHLAALCERTARALEACGYTGLLVHSGSALTVFEDDRTYPFMAHAPFKVWVPLADVPDSYIWFQPGKRPALILNQPRDYWYKPADLPRGYWVGHVEVVAAADATAARAALPADLSRAAYIGDAGAEIAAWGPAAINPRDLMRRLDYDRAVKSPYELACMRESNRIGAL